MMRYTRWVLIIVAGILLACSSNINWGAEHWRTVLQADAKGYHAYLPALVLERDPNFGSFERIERGSYYNPDLFYDYRSQVDGVFINKYFIGTAVMQLPMFLIAHGYALITGAEPDGWSKPYVVAVNLSAIVFVLLGLWCLSKLLASYAINDGAIAFTVVAFTFGTNLFYYAVVAPGMSHAYSFGLCCAFILVGRRLAISPTPERLVWLGILMGAIVLVRPVNGIILLALPILFDRRQQFQAVWQLVRSNSRFVGASVLVCIAIIGLQSSYYYAAMGTGMVYSYGEEGFNWNDPHMMDMLWSYRKGLFIYTPVTLLALVGVRHLWQRSRSATLAWASFFVLLTYVLSSWWNWWYGGSFGSRVYVEFLGLFALLFALAVQGLRQVWRKTFIAATVLLTVLCQIQTYQARYYQIHWSDMDSERYWDVFLRVDQLP
ncbi:MAG: hypothetical protein JNM62_01900 [Flavobacteriales bacterium]|nr:hypothetical protein [Flavobacteriales bacterium]